MKNDDYTANLLGAFASMISTRIEQGITDLGGHSLSHETALVTIYNHPNESIGVLSKVLGLTHSGAVRLINTLEKEQLVQRYKCENDARAIVLRVTNTGQERAKEVLRVREQVTTQVLNLLTIEQQEVLVPMLESVLGSFTEGQQGARRLCRMCNEQVCRPQGCPVEIAVAK
ncbi:MarR family transcriptional regulator [Psychromonas sp. SP041]|uniref:MarR family winged helix-turn-helix transcriptional regulator n=1 Tax=Psychromonas sp. SP041 TaxID=1365007 RepID=UPI00041D010F|nr:MarR family transcriptional regulator [Psychromonas sp. SP041]